MSRPIFAAHLLLPTLIGCVQVFVPLTRADDKIDFAHDVLPILKARCAKCHTAGTYQGGLSIDSRATLLKADVVVRGNSQASELVGRITSEDDELRMPKDAPRLADREIETLRRWIDEGLAWQEGFSFQPRRASRPLTIAPVTVPGPHDGLTNPIDLVLDAYLQTHGRAWPEPVDDRAFLRRLSLDLVGLLPPTAEVEALVNSTHAHKRREAIQRLLRQDRQYAEHWLTFFNDILRNDYRGTGYIDKGRKQITRWLYASLLANKPYDGMVRELIDPTPASEGFIYGIKWRGRINASQRTELQFAQNISQVFLGLNMKCASCHDSFINEWKLSDAYGLASIVSEQPMEMYRCDKATGKVVPARFLFPQLGSLDAAASRRQRLRQTAQLMTDPANGRFARTIVNRLWQRLMGRGLVEPVDVMSNPAWSEELLDLLALRLIEDGYDLKQTIERIVNSRAYQSVSVTAEAADEYVFAGPEQKRMTAEQFIDGVWQLTSTWPKQPVAKVGDRGRLPVRASLVDADALMRSLGRPNREQVVTVRPVQLSTLQALDLTNGQQLAGTLSRGADLLIKQHGDWTAEQYIDHLFYSALARSATSEERVVATELLGSPVTRESLSDLLWALLMLPEFQLIR